VASGSELGKKAKAVMESGGLVSDDIMIGIIREAISDKNCPNGFILDGFPRTTAQAEALDAMLAAEGKKIDHVIELEVDDAEMVARISGRFSCGKCGAGFHDSFKPPKVKDTCDSCGAVGAFTRRADDKAETVAKRLEQYHAMTAPLLPYYRARGTLHGVNGMASIADVTMALQKLIGKKAAA
ncbi:MAG: adenylate kinase family protein, partial [Alphaproteobacteria bacterium]